MAEATSESLTTTRRSGLMVAPLLVFIGHWLARQKVAPALPAAVALAAVHCC